MHAQLVALESRVQWCWQEVGSCSSTAGECYSYGGYHTRKAKTCFDSGLQVCHVHCLFHPFYRCQENFASHHHQ